VIPSPFLSELPLAEIKRIEPRASHDYFDNDFADDFGDELNQDSYPDSWDLPDEGSDVVCEKPDTSIMIDEVAQVPPSPPKAKKKSKLVLAGLQTGADFLSGSVTPLTAYREGAMVRHPEHGEGMILTVTGRGPKRTAKVQFDDGEHSFRLAYAKLELVD
jgi:DNA helicase-2/ATP-dependent DNA helicase PcrA